MNCDRCSTELPEDAVACYRCGRSAEATFVKPLAPSPPQSMPIPVKDGFGIGAVAVIVIVVALSAAAIGGGIAFVVFNQRSGQPQADRGDVPSPLPTTRRKPTSDKEPVSPTRVENQTESVPKENSVKLVNEIRTIGAGEVWAISFSLPLDGRLRGGFRVTAGGEKDIDAVVVDTQNYSLLTSKQGFRSFASRVKVSRGTFDVPLSSGNYFVVLSNKHSWFTAKEVAAEFDINW